MKVSSRQDRSRKAPPVTWTPDLLRRVRSMLNTHTLLEIAEATGLTYRQVDSLLLFKDWFKLRRFKSYRSNVDLSRFSKMDRAYLAGILDGEGTLSFQRTKVKQGNYIRPYIAVATTSPELVEWLEARGWYGTLEHNSNGRGYWRTSVSGWKVGELLTAIRPYLVIKRRHADILIALCKARLRCGHRYAETPEMASLCAELRALNVRGSRMFEHYQELHGLRRSTISSPAATATSRAG